MKFREIKELAQGQNMNSNSVFFAFRIFTPPHYPTLPHTVQRNQASSPMQGIAFTRPLFLQAGLNIAAALEIRTLMNQQGLPLV